MDVLDVMQINPITMSVSPSTQKHLPIRCGVLLSPDRRTEPISVAAAPKMPKPIGSERAEKDVKTSIMIVPQPEIQKSTHIVTE